MVIERSAQLDPDHGSPDRVRVSRLTGGIARSESLPVSRTASARFSPNTSAARSLVCLLRYVFSLAACVGCAPSIADKDAPDFTLEALDGQTVSLREQRGRVVLLNFWATWCVPCREETPVLVNLCRRYCEQGLSLYGIAVRPNRLAVELWVKNFEVPYQVLMTTEEDQRLMELYGADQGIPLSVLIDQTGRIHKVYRGLPEGPNELANELSSDIEVMLSADEHGE